MSFNPVKPNYDKSDEEIRSFLQTRAIQYFQNKAAYLPDVLESPSPAYEMTCISEYRYCAGQLIERVLVPTSDSNGRYVKEFTVILPGNYRYAILFAFGSRHTVTYSDMIAELLRERYNLPLLWYDEMLDG